MTEDNDEETVSFEDLEPTGPAYEIEDVDEIAENGPDWMTPMDVKILDLLFKTGGLILTPDTIAINIDHSRAGVSRRIKTLQASGFIEKVDRGKYRLSHEGYRFLQNI